MAERRVKPAFRGSSPSSSSGNRLLPKSVRVMIYLPVRAGGETYLPFVQIPIISDLTNITPNFLPTSTTCFRFSDKSLARSPNLERYRVFKDGFTVNIMKLPCSCPFQDTGRGPSNDLEMPWIITTHIRKKLDTGFPKFDNNPNIYMTLPIIGCEAERNFSKLAVLKKINFDQPCYMKDWIIFLFSLLKIKLQNRCHMKRR